MLLLGLRTVTAVRLNLCAQLIQLLCVPFSHPLFGNQAVMDLANNVEIYIPKNAEVKCVPLQSFPSNVLKQIRRIFSDTPAFETLADSQATWICPVMIRNKGQPMASSCPGKIKNVSSVLSIHIRRKPGPLHMCFVTHNPAAHRVLKNAMPGSCSSREFQLPEGSAPKEYRNAVIIYRKCVFLSINNLHNHHTQQETQNSKPVHRSAFLTTSAITSSSEVKECHDKGKKATQKVKHLEHKQDATYGKEDDLLSAKFRPHAGQRSASVDQVNSEHNIKVSGERIAVEKQATHAHSKRYVEEDSIKDFGGDVEMLNQCPGVSENLDFKKRSSVIGHSNHSQGADRRESPSADAPVTFQQLKCDYSALAQEETLAELKLQLQQGNATLNNLTSSK